MLQLINKGQIKKFKTATKSRLLLVVVFCFFIFLLTPCLTQGQEVNPTTIVQPELELGLEYAEQIGLPTTDIRLIIANIIRIALGMLGLMAVIIIIYGGWLWMSAGGNEEQIDKAKKTLINGSIGLFIILSAYSIVVFVMNLLGLGGRGSFFGDGDYSYQQPGIMNAVGSGAWGKAITDHYPLRNQTDVPRNTKIAITFAKPIKLESVAQEVSDELGRISYNLITSTIAINSRVSSTTAPRGFVLIPFTGNVKVYIFPIETTTLSGATTSEIFTIVLSPETLLGDDQSNITYSVKVNSSLQGADGRSIFSNTKFSYYEWFFTCSIVEDLTPPYVTSVYPTNGITSTKDVTVEINFNEPIFPNAQVSFVTSGSGTSEYYKDKVNTNDPIVFIKTGNSTMPLGTFKITNQYRTLEFISSLECGKDPCGEFKYCLPVCDKQGANCEEDLYQVVFRTAPGTQREGINPFVADLAGGGSGIMDMAGNAMDGNKDGVYNRNTSTPFTGGFLDADNYAWQFLLEDKVDTTTPYITNLSLGPETGTVLAGEDLNITWSKLMKKSSLYSIEIDEYPNPEDRCEILIDIPDNKINNKSQCSLETLGKAPSSTNVLVGEDPVYTYTQILHTPFLDGFYQYYLPEITSAVKDNKGNCYFPGKGPSNEGRNVYCTESNNCCSGPYCCNGVAKAKNYSATCTIDKTGDYNYYDIGN